MIFFSRITRELYALCQRSDGGRSLSLVHVSGTLFPLTLRLPLAGRLWTAFKDRIFSPLLQRCLTIFSTLIVVLEMDFLFRPLKIFRLMMMMLGVMISRPGRSLNLILPDVIKHLRGCLCHLIIDIRDLLSRRRDSIVTNVDRCHIPDRQTHPFNGLLSKTTWLSRHQIG